ncbi:hypothetical protein BN1708_010331 [Verticillium longisporum]|uniref:Uncharacterized protein n=1 Tax=Verticillium longisporum TaxID=100787 RepID=A0A0G4KQT9_VERLO|nr:hypothetical protein BN1708_010331 [Verticillium longisporum]
MVAARCAAEMFPRSRGNLVRSGLVAGTERGGCRQFAAGRKEQAREAGTSTQRKPRPRLGMRTSHSSTRQRGASDKHQPVMGSVILKKQEEAKQGLLDISCGGDGGTLRRHGGGLRGVLWVVGPVHDDPSAPLTLREGRSRQFPCCPQHRVEHCRIDFAACEKAYAKKRFQARWSRSGPGHWSSALVPPGGSAQSRPCLLHQVEAAMSIARRICRERWPASLIDSTLQDTAQCWLPRSEGWHPLLWVPSSQTGSS